MSERITKFENALIELIDMHMDDGLTADEVSLVLLTRAYDDFNAGREADPTKVIGGPQTGAVERLAKSGA